jgi:hypothetical protein
MRVVVTIPDEQWPAVCDSYARVFGYQNEIIVDGARVANPETIEQHCSRRIAEQVLQLHVRTKTRVAIDETAKTTRTRVRGEVGLE